MGEWDKEDVLRKVRLLLDKAGSTTFEAEADSFRQKADDLMLRYAITAYELDIARGATNRREMPELIRIDVCDSTSIIKDQLITLMGAVARHTRCRVVFYGASANFKGQKVSAALVGFPSDTAYAEMLFTSLWLQLSRQTEPKPADDMTFEENVVMLLESGQSRKRIAELMELEWSHQLGMKMSKIYKAWTAEHGRSGQRPLPITYVRNFSEGFVIRVSDRLYQMKKRQEDDGLLKGTELVLFDRNKEVEAFFANQFPKLGTHRSRRQGKFAHGARMKGEVAGDKADLGLDRLKSDGRRALNG